LLRKPANSSDTEIKCCEFFFAAMKNGRDFLWKPKNSLETETKCCKLVYALQYRSTILASPKPADHTFGALNLFLQIPPFLIFLL